MADPSVQDRVVPASESFSVIPMDRTEKSNKTKRWKNVLHSQPIVVQCVTTLSSGCSPHVEYLGIKCRSFYLLREFTLIIATVVYISPHTDTGMALSELHHVLSVFQNKNPGTALTVGEQSKPQTSHDELLQTRYVSEEESQTLNHQ